jgi:hypothetical protein
MVRYGHASRSSMPFVTEIIAVIAELSGIFTADKAFEHRKQLFSLPVFVNDQRLNAGGAFSSAQFTLFQKINAHRNRHRDPPKPISHCFICRCTKIYTQSAWILQHFQRGTNVKTKLVRSGIQSITAALALSVGFARRRQAA